MNDTNKFLILSLGISLLLTLTACSKKAANTETKTDTETVSMSSSDHAKDSTDAENISAHSEDMPSDDQNRDENVLEGSSTELPTYGEGTMMSCTSGLLVYYNQADPRWANERYGPTDFMKSHGCGPTAVAMIVSSFTNNLVTPLDVALWASQNGYCSSGEGSKHSLIPDGLANYGLTVTPLEERSIDAILKEVQSGKIIIALMNKGYFTNSGHFLLLTQVMDDGKLQIADPASWENTNMAWDPEFILAQVRTHSDAGGPLWVVSMPSEE